MKKFLLLILTISAFSTYAQQMPVLKETDTAALIKASYLYNFSKGVDWPVEDKSGNFVISVMGGNTLYQELVENYNSKQIGSQQIEIRKLSKTTNISECHVLYVGKDCLDILPEISKALSDKSTLIVGDGPNSLNNGAALNFVVTGADLDFELNVNNATQRNLFIGSTLKSLAIRIQ
jgi:hypothetical protein